MAGKKVKHEIEVSANTKKAEKDLDKLEKKEKDFWNKPSIKKMVYDYEVNVTENVTRKVKVVEDRKRPSGVLRSGNSARTAISQYAREFSKAYDDPEYEEVEGGKTQAKTASKIKAYSRYLQDRKRRGRREWASGQRGEARVTRAQDYHDKRIAKEKERARKLEQLEDEADQLLQDVDILMVQAKQKQHAIEMLKLAKEQAKVAMDQAKRKKADDKLFEKIERDRMKRHKQHNKDQVKLFDIFKNLFKVWMRWRPGTGFYGGVQGMDVGNFVKDIWRWFGQRGQRQGGRQAPRTRSGQPPSRGSGSGSVPRGGGGGVGSAVAGAGIGAGATVGAAGGAAMIGGGSSAGAIGAGAGTAGLIGAGSGSAAAGSGALGTTVSLMLGGTIITASLTAIVATLGTILLVIGAVLVVLGVLYVIYKVLKFIWKTIKESQAYKAIQEAKKAPVEAAFNWVAYQAVKGAIEFVRYATHPKLFDKKYGKIMGHGGGPLASSLNAKGKNNEALSNWIKASSKTTWEWLKKATSTGINAVTQIVLSGWSTIGQIFNTVVKIVVDFVVGRFEWLVEQAGIAWDFVKGIPGYLTKAWDWLSTEATRVWDFMTGDVPKTITSGWNKLTSAASLAWDSVNGSIITPIVNGLSSIATKAASYFDSVSGTFVTTITGGLSWVWDRASYYFDSVTGVITTGITGGFKAIELAWGLTSPVLSELVGYVTDIASQKFDEVKTSWQTFIDSVSGAKETVFDKVAETWTTMVENGKKIVDFFLNFGTILDGFFTALGKMWDVFKSVMSQIWDALKLATGGKFDEAAKAVEGAVNTAIGFIEGIISKDDTTAKKETTNILLGAEAIKDAGLKFGKTVIAGAEAFVSMIKTGAKSSGGTYEDTVDKIWANGEGA